MDERQWWIWGCILWGIGSVLFFVAALRADDPYGAVGSLAFVVGVGLFLVPLRRRRPSTR